MAYLRRVRMDHAHADLLAATFDDGTTVSAVAARWGFFGPSRFAADYRTAYGCLPRETLRRAQGLDSRDHDPRDGDPLDPTG